MSEYAFRLLGGFEGRFRGELLTGLSKARPRSLLAYLLLHRDQQLTRHGLAEVFWPDSSESQARTNLRNLLHRVRKALPDPELIAMGAVEIGIASEVEVDVHRASALIDQIEDHTGDPQTELALLTEAHACMRGPLLPGCRDAWVFEPREHFERRAGEIADDLARLCERTGDLRGAIRVSREALGHHPALEPLHRRLIRVLALDGDRAGALRAYHACAAALAQVGARPSEDTEALVRPLRSAPAEAVPEVPFVGRATLWSELTELLQQASGPPQVLCLRGEAGIGKTRAVDQLCRWGRQQGFTTATAHSYAGDASAAYGPVSEWLRQAPLRAGVEALDDGRASELSRLLPELADARPNLASPEPLAKDWQRTRFFEVLGGVFGQAGVGLLVLDDVQWTDASTLAWLGHFLTRAEAPGLVVLFTERTGEPVPDGLIALQTQLGRQGRYRSWTLPPLSPSAATELARALVPGGSGETLDKLCTEAEGNPLFLVELARHAESAGGDPALPERLGQVITGRLAQLTKEAVVVAQTSAVLGREVAWSLLEQCLTLDELAAADALDELWSRGVLRERGSGAYDFAHDKIRQAVIEATPPGRRRILHRRAADAMAALTARPWSQIAGHREAAGQISLAADAHRHAAQEARKVFANGAAIHHLRRHLELVGPDPSTGDVAVQLAELLHRGAALDEAHELVARTLQLSGLTGLNRARLLGLDAEAFISDNRYTEATAALDEAEAALDGHDDSEEERRLWIDLKFIRAGARYWQGDAVGLKAITEDMQATVEAHGTDDQRARHHLGVANLIHRTTRYGPGSEAVEHAQLSWEASQRVGDLQAMGEFRFMLGFAQLWDGRLDEARTAFEHAARLAVQTGTPWLELRARTYLCIHMRLTHDRELQAQIDATRPLAIQLRKEAYVAVCDANSAVLALRRGDTETAIKLATGAVEAWGRSSLAYPFQWTALLVLLATRPESADCERLQHASQQQLPTMIAEALARGDHAAAVAAARETGHL